MFTNIHYNWAVLNGVNVATGLSLGNWCAFLPDQAKGEDSHWLSAEQALDVSFLPPLKRRRLSKLSRLSLRLAHTVAPDYQGYCVFGSQHGELVTTQGLLESIVQGEVVSPAGFSASVHNTAVGLHSINCKNTYPCTSIAAGQDTLAMCFIETGALLQTGEAKQVLLVYADDELPEGLACFVKDNEPKGFAALVKLGDAAADNILNLEQQVQVGEEEQTKLSESIRSLVSLLTKTGLISMVTPGEIGQWRWEYHVK